MLRLRFMHGAHLVRFREKIQDCLKILVLVTTYMAGNVLRYPQTYPVVFTQTPVVRLPCWLVITYIKHT